MIDPAPLLQKVAEFADELEAEYGEGAEIIDAIIFVEVSHTVDDDGYEADEHGTTFSTVAGRSISGRNVVALGLATRAVDALRGQYGAHP